MKLYFKDCDNKLRLGKIGKMKDGRLHISCSTRKGKLTNSYTVFQPLVVVGLKKGVPIIDSISCSGFIKYVGKGLFKMEEENVKEESHNF